MSGTADQLPPTAPAEGESFFRSRWVTRPEGVSELDPSGLAPGFVAGGAHAGIKALGGTDVGIVAVADPGIEVSSALLLTRNASAAAPIKVCRERCEQGRLRAVAVNSGNANAATGEQGLADAIAMQQQAAEALSLRPEEVAIAETGVIGVPLEREVLLSGITAVAGSLSGAGGPEFNAAIMTTDQWPKHCCVTADGVTVSAQAKGAGMIQPGFATMLCFIQTDAVVAEPEPLLRAAVAGSFERITVDGQMSTNDTVCLQASGTSGRPLPGDLLEEVLLQLAIEIIADGEGAARICRVDVAEAADPDEAERVARAIANSPLVKTALHGRDPNWGRVAQAAGMELAGEQLPELGPDRIDAEGLGGSEIEAELAVRLGRGEDTAHVYFSDLSKAYVELNAEYTT